MSSFIFILVLLSAFLHAFWNFIAKTYASNKAVFGLSFFVGWLGLPCFFSPDIFPHTSTFWWGMVATSVVHVVYSAGLIFAYSKYDLSTIYPLSRSIGILGVTGFGVVFLHEQLGVLGALGVALVIAGVLIKSFAYFFQQTLGSVFSSVVIGTLVASYIILDFHVSQGINPFYYMFLLNAFMSIGMLPILYWDKDSSIRAALLTQKRYIFCIAFGGIGSYGLILYVFQQGPIGVVIALRECAMIFGALLGYFVLKESFTPSKTIGIGLVILGAIFLKIA